MKIAINGDIIDTKNIFNITEIEQNLSSYSGWYYEFKIFSLNKTHYKTVLSFFNISNKIEMEKKRIKINEFRDSIIKIWSENQSEIPQFNL